MNVSAHRRLAGRIVAATHNKGKLAELRDLRRAARDRGRRRGRARPAPNRRRPATRSLANALIKARAAAEAAGMVALADDSGLCVVGARRRAGHLFRALGGRGRGLRAPRWRASRASCEARGAAKAVARLFRQRARAGLAGRPYRSLRGPRRRRPDVSSPGDRRVRLRPDVHPRRPCEDFRRDDGGGEARPARGRLARPFPSRPRVSVARAGVPLSGAEPAGGGERRRSGFFPRNGGFQGFASRFISRLSDLSTCGRTQCEPVTGSPWGQAPISVLHRAISEP